MRVGQPKLQFIRPDRQSCGRDHAVGCFSVCFLGKRAGTACCASGGVWKFTVMVLEMRLLISRQPSKGVAELCFLK